MATVDKKKAAKEFLLPIVIASVIVFAVTRFIGFGFVQGSSMKPTYNNGKFFIYQKTKDIEQNDIVMFYSKKLKADLIKRVIANENTTLEIKNGDLYIDGTFVDEPYLKHKDKSLNVSCYVPRGYIYVLGDNRNHSVDSRKFGLVKISDVYGKMLGGN